MSILVDEKTRVVVQGFTGREATFHAEQSIAYGTTVIGRRRPRQGRRRCTWTCPSSTPSPRR